MDLALLAIGLIAAAALLPVLPSVVRATGVLKRNFEGAEVGAAGGALFVAGAAGLWYWQRATDLLTLAVLGFGALGFIDDCYGNARYKGLRGHLTALRRGEVTTGLIKLLGGVVLAGCLAWRLRSDASAFVSAALIALAANLFNLLDLRPLRALKAFWLFGGALAPFVSPTLALMLGLSLPYAVLESRRRVMLGDTGANGLGALVGAAAAFVLPFWAQAPAAALLLAFHLWAEKHSLTRWIEDHPTARAIDGWGWRR